MEQTAEVPVRQGKKNMELRFGEEDNRKDGKKKTLLTESHRQTGDLLKDLYGDLYRPGVQAGEADPSGKSQAQSTLEQEMDALSRAQAALMEAAMKFNRQQAETQQQTETQQAPAGAVCSRAPVLPSGL